MKKSMSRKKRFVLIDGHALLHRAYHAYPKSLTTTKGELVNAVYGFTSNLFSVFKQLDPEYVAVAFDLKEPTFRHKEFKDYKASRPKVDKELIDQIDRVKQVVKVLNIPIFEVAGFEADDVIGTLSAQAKQDMEVIIATGDKDALQLLKDKVKVFFPGRGRIPARLMDRKEFEKEYGFAPRNLVDYKALAGDASDDIPGVGGIGPKKAAGLIKKFVTVENLYDQLKKEKNIDRLMAKTNLGKKDIERLINSRKQAFLSKKLAEIVKRVPIKLKLAACKLTDYDIEEARKLFLKLEFRTLLGRLPGREVRLVKKKAKTEKKNKEQQMVLFK